MKLLRLPTTKLRWVFLEMSAGPTPQFALEMGQIGVNTTRYGPTIS